jgi:uncharacterized membrane protein
MSHTETSNMIVLALAAAAFAVIHLGISGTRLRDLLVARFGQAAYMIAFSVASVAVLSWLIIAYKAAPYLPTWGNPDAFRPVAIILMLPAFLLVVIGLATPNPTAVAQESLAFKQPQGIVCITRHPFLMGVAIWSLIHLIANGDVASLLFFGALAVVSLAGPASIDKKRRRSLGPDVWDAFAAKTSILPFKAILEGRAPWKLRSLGLWRPAAGVAAYALMLGGHAHIIGVSPFP